MLGRRLEDDGGHATSFGRAATENNGITRPSSHSGSWTHVKKGKPVGRKNRSDMDNTIPKQTKTGRWVCKERAPGGKWQTVSFSSYKTVEVPEQQMGRVIGKAGAGLKNIRESTGVSRCNVIKGGFALLGSSEAVAAACMLIEQAAASRVGGFFEKRVDPSNGRAYSFKEFQSFYKDRAEELWKKAGRLQLSDAAGESDAEQSLHALRTRRASVSSMSTDMSAESGASVPVSEVADPEEHMAGTSRGKWVELAAKKPSVDAYAHSAALGARAQTTSSVPRCCQCSRPLGKVGAGRLCDTCQRSGGNAQQSEQSTATCNTVQQPLPIVKQEKEATRHTMEQKLQAFLSLYEQGVLSAQEYASVCQALFGKQTREVRQLTPLQEEPAEVSAVSVQTPQQCSAAVQVSAGTRDSALDAPSSAVEFASQQGELLASGAAEDAQTEPDASADAEEDCAVSDDAAEADHSGVVRADLANDTAQVGAQDATRGGIQTPEGSDASLPREGGAESWESAAISEDVAVSWEDEEDSREVGDSWEDAEDSREVGDSWEDAEDSREVGDSWQSVTDTCKHDAPPSVERFESPAVAHASSSGVQTMTSHWDEDW